MVGRPRGRSELRPLDSVSTTPVRAHADLPATVSTNPLNASSTVHKPTPADYSELVRTLARAYYRDAVFSWYFPDDSRRLQQLTEVFAVFGGAALFSFDETYATDDLGGVAIWVPPEKWKMCAVMWSAAVHGLATEVGLPAMPRPLRGLYLMQSRHRQEPAHYYLPLIAVARSARARASARAVAAGARPLRPGRPPRLPRSDDTGQPRLRRAQRLRGHNA
jgi:hypothetical protein